CYASRKRRKRISARKKRRTAVYPNPATSGHAIHPQAVFTIEEATRALSAKNNTLRREVRQGRLRGSKRAGRYYILGEWLLEWIRRGEIRPRIGIRGEPENETMQAV